MDGDRGPPLNLIDFMMDRRSYPERPSSIKCYETHISCVFVGDRFVYKIKKPVNFGFLDFTTLARRRYLCHQEMALNSRLAPGIYLDVVPIYESDGRYTFHETEGARVVEYAVKMKRLPEELLLHRQIAEGALLFGLLTETGDILGRFHHAASVHRSDTCGRINIVRAETEENFRQIKECVGITIEKAFYSRLVDYTRSFIDAHVGLFDQRKNDGWIREGHGDLHSRHVCLTEPQVIFDCIEFNKRFRVADVLADIAFLTMDLEFSGRFDLSSALDKAYFSVLPDVCMPELLRFYKVYRAVVRGKIEGFTADAMTDEFLKRSANDKAINYYSLARYYIEEADRPFNPVVLMGVSGVGKSAIARGLLPAAVVLRSDEIRKRIAGVDVNSHADAQFHEGIYRPDMTTRVYEVMADEAILTAAAGRRVIVDATFLKSGQRVEFYEACVAADLNPFFIHCFGDPDLLAERVRARRETGNDISDADVGILRRQLETAEEPVELPYFRVMRLNAAKEPVERIRQSLNSFL